MMEERTPPTELKAAPNCCEEASTLSGEKYIPCNAPATRLVQMRGGDIYRMCNACAHHSIKNRGGADMGPYVYDAPATEDTPGQGHNNPPTPYDERVARTQELVAQGDAWKQLAAIESQAQAERCNDLLALVAAAAKENKAALDAEVDPLKAQVTEISGRYKRLGAAPNLSGLDEVSFLGKMSAILKRLRNAWLEKLDREKREAEKKAREEAQEAARKAEEAAKQAKTIADQIAAEEAAKAAEAASRKVDQIANTKVAIKGEIGQRATGFRGAWKATAITNLDDALAYYKTSAAVHDLLLKLASADARAGRKRIPGFKIEMVRSV